MERRLGVEADPRTGLRAQGVSWLVHRLHGALLTLMTGARYLDLYYRAGFSRRVRPVLIALRSRWSTHADRVIGPGPQELIDVLGLDGPLLVGDDWSGELAWIFTHRYSHLIRGSPSTVRTRGHSSGPSSAWSTYRP